MTKANNESENPDKGAPDELLAALDGAIDRLAEINAIEGVSPVFEVIDAARPLMLSPAGLEALYERVPAIESAGFFRGSDWDYPQTLVPSLAARTIRHGEPTATLVESLSQIRLLAVAKGDYTHVSISAEHAHHFLAQVLAMNLDLVVGDLHESDRLRPEQIGYAVQNLYHYLLRHLGYENLLEHLVAEVWRILEQRPVQVEGVKHMVTQIAVCLEKPDALGGEASDDAVQLIHAVFSPTEGCREDPGLDVYGERLAEMDDATLLQEAIAFARAMHSTGLVSPYMPVFIRYLRGRWNELIPTALGLSYTGADAFHCYPALIHRLIDEALFPETSQCAYGLAMMLERGILYAPPVAPSLWRQIRLTLCDAAAEKIVTVFGSSRPPECFLLADVLNVLGRPLGIGQGNYPTCQSTRALSMWAYNMPAELLRILAWAARDDEIVMRFEGNSISSRELGTGLATEPPVDVDAVSLLTVPHLDRIYFEMGRRSIGRGEDPHKWVNAEFHGDHVGHGFRIAVDVFTGGLKDFDGFIRDFYAAYHPFYNGDIPVINPQPAGIAVTDSATRFLGWHAITIQRLALDADKTMRVYFFNPNNDSGQNWGQGIVTSTHEHGERFGEASLPVAEFVSRLYVFHYDPIEKGDPSAIPTEEVNRARELAKGSWAAGR
ncbi:hypothetical protein SAMN05216203_1280 [Marinobacter daqiaonensis]|uniref:Uncharacterized protein n=1 Tax=Marinobacter daqiaonensis TaxID=650891 RepID=A0A1I6HJ08_9GAMM|nr:hypothetical protein [Marinobacter daqiaonensis]SFR54386.1 hypothetical protein SAMN05216203_1280 [Marinobacter daqiaonensis]